MHSTEGLHPVNGQSLPEILLTEIGPTTTPRIARHDRRRYIYIVDFGSTTKIGISCNPWQRTSSFKTSYGKTVLHRLASQPLYEAKTIERSLLAMFHKDRISGSEFVNVDFEFVRRALEALPLEDCNRQDCQPPIQTDHSDLTAIFDRPEDDEDPVFHIRKSELEKIVGDAVREALHGLSDKITGTLLQSDKLAEAVAYLSLPAGNQLRH